VSLSACSGVDAALHVPLAVRACEGDTLGVIVSVNDCDGDELVEHRTRRLIDSASDLPSARLSVTR